MAGEQARVASAYIDIKARKAFANAELRRMGEEAGEEYRKGFDKAADKGLTGSKGRHAAQGKQVGADIGDAAGKEAGARTSKGIAEGLAKSRSRRVRDGEQVGEDLGDGASRGFGSRFLSRLRVTSATAGKVLESDVYKGLDKGFKRGLIGGRGIFSKATSLTGITALISSASGLGTVLAGTAGAAVALSGAVGLLPGVLAGAGIAAGALRIGLMGVGDAISDSGDPEKYAAALKQLSPAAQSFTRAVVKLKPELKDLRREVQDGLFRGADREVERLGARYLPILSRGLRETTQAFGRGRASVAAYLDTAQTASTVTGILDDTSKASGRLSTAFTPFVASFLDIASVGASFLPDLTSKLAGAADRFAAFTSTTRGSGAMREFFQDGIDAVGDFGNALKGAGRILAGVFSAGGGPNTSALETLGVLLNRVADQIGRPEFQQGLGRFFAAISSAGDAVGAALPRVGDALVALEPAISNLVRGSGSAFASILTSVSAAAVAVAPTLNVLSRIIAGIAPVAGPVVLVLLAFKAALLAFKAAQTTADVLGRVGLAMRSTGDAAGQATGKTDRFRRSLNLGTKAVGAFTAVTIGQQIFGQFTDGADASVVKVGKLTDALKKFQSGQDAGQVGILGKNFADLGKQLDQAAGPGLIRRLEDMQGKVASLLTKGLTGGKSDGSGKGGFFSIDTGVSSAGGKQATELAKSLRETDAYLSSLVSGGNGQAAAALFAKLNQAAIAGGAGVGELASRLPAFTSALAASGGSVDATTGKVTGLRKSLQQLSSETDAYANKTLAANDSARGYQAALDSAREAVKRNGESLDITTGKGRENSAALDAIAQSGIELAKQFAGDGPNAQARFRESLTATRGDLIRAGVRFGLSKEAARRYADQILKIPSRASTRIATPGADAALAKIGSLIAQSNRINGRVYTFTYRQVFETEGRRDEAWARKASGGLIDRRLGGPRQDNVPLLVSGGEFVMNAFATSQPGVLALLKKINASNQMPQTLASGGQVVGRASQGMGDLTASAPARMVRIENSRTPAPGQATTVDADAIGAAVAAAVGRELRKLSVRLDSGAIAGAVLTEGGRW